MSEVTEQTAEQAQTQSAGHAAEQPTEQSAAFEPAAAPSAGGSETGTEQSETASLGVAVQDTTGDLARAVLSEIEANWIDFVGHTCGPHRREGIIRAALERALAR